MGGARQRRDAAGGARRRTRGASACIRCRRSPRRGAEQLDGAWAAVTAETPSRPGARLRAGRRARPDAVRARATIARVLYHAGAAVASNYLVTLHRAAGRAARAAGAPPEALVPLMRRTIENGFELDRTDRAGRLGDSRAPTWPRSATPSPELERMYRALAEVTARCTPSTHRCRAAARSRRLRAASQRHGAARARADDGRAARRPPRAVARARRRVRLRRGELVRQPGAVRRSERSRRLSPRRGSRPRASPRRRASTSSSSPLSPSMYPPATRRGSRSRSRRAGSKAIPAGALPRRGHDLSEALHDVEPDVAPTSARRTRSRWRSSAAGRDFDLELEIRVVPTVRDADGLALSSRNVLPLASEDASARSALPRALARRATPRCGAASPRSPAGLDVDYVAVADFDGARPRRRRPRRRHPPDRQRRPRRGGAA